MKCANCGTENPKQSVRCECGQWFIDLEKQNKNRRPNIILILSTVVVVLVLGIILKEILNPRKEGNSDRKNSAQVIRKETTTEIINSSKIAVTTRANIEIKYKEGMDLLHLGKYDEGLKCFDEILKADGSNKKAKIMKAACLAVLGRDDEARKLYIGKSLADKIHSGQIFDIFLPDNDDAYLNIKKDLKLYDAILNIDNKLKDIWCLKGVSYISTWVYESKKMDFGGKDWQERERRKRLREKELERSAFICFEEALKIDPNYEPARKLMKSSGVLSQ